MAKALIQGASRGIGLQFCQSLVRDGISVIACCREPNSASHLLQLKENFPSMVDIVQLDVTKDEEIKNASKYVQSEHNGRLDLLINCSGILHPTGRGETSIEKITFEGLQSTFFVNAFGPVMMGRYFAPYLQSGRGLIGCTKEDKISQHTGILVNMSARVGSIEDNRFGGWYSYRMSKAALNMATKTLSIELGRGNNKVICVALHPGTVATDFTLPYRKNIPGKLFSTEKSVNYLLKIIKDLSLEDSGKFLDWKGEQVPY